MTKIKTFVLSVIKSRNFVGGVLRFLIQKSRLGKYSTRLLLNIVPRPEYGHCLFEAAKLAQKLGQKSISVIEFGVAGGNGLINLEFHAAKIEKQLGIEIQIYGFDTGYGLPKPTDYRDLPYHWKEGFYKVDLDKLNSRLLRSKLVIGDVQETVKLFLENFTPAPIGAILFDLDYYSSTKNAMSLLSNNPKHFLPRVFCYFDDVLGGEIELYGEHTGERLAIAEYNAESTEVKISTPYYLRIDTIHKWHQQIWICHFFKHAQYNDFVSVDHQQAPIRR
jgi:hypothetical protein